LKTQFFFKDTVFLDFKKGFKGSERQRGKGSERQRGGGLDYFSFLGY
jgi:hypothetical protein